MTGPDVVAEARYFVGLLVVITAVVLIGGRAGIGLGWRPFAAMARATLQLAVVALLLRGVFADPWTVLAFVVLMFSTASVTASGRIRELYQGRRAAVAGVLGGGLTAIVAVLVLGLVQLNVNHVVAVAGIVIGNAMSASTLAGRHFLTSSRQRAAEIEGWLALGATPEQAHADIGREAARESLLANLDQTRSTGLVTLPGAFVGALFGGASPWEAAKFQLVVLAAIALAMTITAIVVTRLAGRTPYVLDPR